MAKVLVTESVHPSGTDLIAAAGHQIIYANRNMAAIQREIVDADAVLVRIIDLPRSLLETAKRLKMISKHGVGLDNIDLDYCRESGITVTITPNANSLSIAEHAFALMMTLAKNIVPVSAAYKAIGFAAKNSKEGMELTGKTVGIIGLGRIGRLFAMMCHQGFGMNILAYDPYIHNTPEGVTLVSDIETILRKADVLSLHTALTEETRFLINAQRLACMKSTAILINCARGPIVEEKALIEALRAGQLAGAGLDVTDPEPMEPDNPLFKMENVIVTPHYAPTTIEAAIRVSKMAGENINAYFGGQEPEGRVI